MYNSNCQDSDAGLLFLEPASLTFGVSRNKAPSWVDSIPGAVLADMLVKSNVRGFCFMETEWRDVSVGLPEIPCGYYSVSATGQVRRDSDEGGATRGRILRFSTNRNGYRRINLSVKSKHRRIRIAELVAFCFLGPRPAGLTIDHVNGIKADDRLSNLEYITRQEQMDRAKALGLLATGERNGSRTHPERLKRGADWPKYARPETIARGEGHGNAKLNNEKIRMIRKSTAPAKVLARELEVSSILIYKIRKKEIWAHVDD